ncbi:hypothetical protein [Streptomyces sp. NPDC058644]|uniref:hypothetical protein n=1 Tax=unclassified Streptomyces TaxID=2593676 RepID=UPI003668617D
MKRLARAATAALLIMSVPVITGAAAYDWLNQEWWTSTSSAAAPARPETRPEPAPSPQAAPEPPRTSRHPWPAGSCVTPAATRTECQAGALRVVASLHTHRGTPCHDVPETDHVRRVGAYTLCLATL